MCGYIFVYVWGKPVQVDQPDNQSNNETASQYNPGCTLREFFGGSFICKNFTIPGPGELILKNLNEDKNGPEP
jgi:hypothetical protein